MLIYDDSPDILESFWIKNDETINFEDSDRKLLEGNIDNPSLTLENVSPDDAGVYQLTAINAVGLRTSEVIILGQYFKKIQYDFEKLSVVISVSTVYNSVDNSLLR